MSNLVFKVTRRMEFSRTLMKRFSVLTIGIAMMFLCCCNFSSQIENIRSPMVYEPEIGCKVDWLKVELANPIMIMVRSGQFSLGYNILVNQINYDIILNNDSIITFISTSDPNYITKNDIKVGINYGYICKKLQINNFIHELGWASYTSETNGDWNIAFTYIDSSDLPKDDSKVIFLFKRMSTDVQNPM